MFGERILEVLRDVSATLIPTGESIKLQKGATVQLTQALGTSYTVYINGNLVRVQGIDGDALGLVVLKLPDINQEEGSIIDKVWKQLKTCFDPEIPVNIVDLGLVYDCNVRQNSDIESNVYIQMTLTAPGCGMGPILVSEVEEKIRLINGITSVTVELVFDPPWDRERMSDEAKLQLGLF